MAFSDFKSISEVQKRYKIRYTEADFLGKLELSPPSTFLDDFRFNQTNIDIFTSEASRSEIIISPLLREVYKNHYQNYSSWIQKSSKFAAHHIEATKKAPPQGGGAFQTLRLAERWD